jgi:hypothetical protein
MPAETPQPDRPELDGRLRDAAWANDLARARQLVAAALCCHAASDSPWETHAVIGIDVADRRLRILDGSPCTAAGGRWTDV